MLSTLKFWLADFVPYATESWAGLIGDYNQTYWPYSLAAIPAVIAMLLLAGARPYQQRCMALWLLAGCWVWAGMVFLRHHYAVLNWVGRWLCWLLVLQALLLIACSLSRRFRNTVTVDGQNKGQYLLVVVAMLFIPLLQFIAGHQSHQLGWFALTPDATALTTIAILGMLKFVPWTLIVIPLLWALFVFATAWPLGDLAGMSLLPIMVMVLLWFRKAGA